MIRNKPATNPMVIFVGSACEFHQSEDAKKYKELYLEHGESSMIGTFVKTVSNLQLIIIF